MTDAPAAPGPLSPAVCFGAVMHERLVQAHNRFVYPTAFVRLPLGRLDEIRAPLLGIDRFNLVSVLAGASGLISPLAGAVVHNVGSVLVVLSSASLGLYRGSSH